MNSTNTLKVRDDHKPLEFAADGDSFKLQAGSDASWLGSEVFAHKELRNCIEHWLTSLFQSEHLSLLAGSGLTHAVHYLAAGKGAAGMGALTLGHYQTEITGAAKKAAEAAGREQDNLEDQLRVANELLRGLEEDRRFGCKRRVMAEFSKKQKKVLRKLRESKPLCHPELGEAECFVLNFISFEAQARRIWHYYRCRKKVKTESKAGIPIAELKKAMDHFGIQFDEGKLNALLDSKLNKREEKSARNLRNGMVHQWLEGDCKEATKRCDEFLGCFNAFDSALGEVL